MVGAMGHEGLGECDGETRGVTLEDDGIGIMLACLTDL